MGQSQIVTIAQVFIFKCRFPCVAVVIAKAPYFQGFVTEISCNCLHMRIRRFVLLKSFLFLHCIFPVRKSIFRKSWVCIRWSWHSLWSVFKQVWQQAASLLSSWCNHLNRSNHAVWNDFLWDSYSRRSLKFFGCYGQSDTFTKTWSGGLSCVIVVSVFISGLFFDSDFFFDLTRLCH